MSQWTRSGYIVDIHQRKIYPGTVTVKDGKIESISKDAEAKTPFYIMPGFIDAHVHVESSMLIPSEFARLAVVHGTVGTVSDPHEIGNVLGVEGVRYMVRNGKKVPFHFYFGVPSCVPATSFETAGAEISPKEVEEIFLQDKLKYLSEMMNYPGVLHKDPQVMQKIAIAHRLGKPVDGHAPGLKGDDARQYIAAGISTDHECFTLEEALDKVQAGMKIIIREGSAARNYDALHPLIAQYPDKIMFCSDDKHPHELVKGHINQLVARSVTQEQYDLFDVLCIASLYPVKHYDLDIGLLRPGDSADFILVDNLKDFKVHETFINGHLVAKDGQTFISRIEEREIPNHFRTGLKKPADFIVEETGANIQLIHPDDGQLITHAVIRPACIVDHQYVANPKNDLLKIVVVNRYTNARPAVAFIENFGLERGALASCVEHDSHNIIAVGCTDEELAAAVNAIIENKGGISLVDGNQVDVLPLPVAGIMSAEDGYIVAKKYTDIDAKAKKLGTKLKAPFMTLSFMGLLVIPELKLSDKGLFDGRTFQFTSLSADLQVNKPS